MRAKKSLWPQIEATFKQMDIAATEFECFQALQKQEQLAATHRINNIWAEVQKQKELEKTLQKRYGDNMAELERIQNIMDQFRLQAQQQEEIEAQNHALESSEAAADKIDVQGTENHEAVPLSVDQQVDIVQDQVISSSINDMDVDSCKEDKAHNTDIKLPDAPAAADESGNVAEGNNIDNRETTLDKSVAVEIGSIQANGKDRDVENPDEVVNAVVDKPDEDVKAVDQPDSTRETTLDEGDNIQVADGKREEVN